jgi:hypothetical protein
MRTVALQTTPSEQKLWLAIHQLSLEVPIDRWGIFGGQMVRLHAALESVVWPRVTTDADIGVDVRGHTRDVMRDISSRLLAMGFQLNTSIDGVSRFSQPNAAIDLLAPEGMGTPKVQTVGSGHAVQAPGLSQAFTRMITVSIQWQSVATVIRIPSLLSAFITKAATCSEIPSLTSDQLLRHQQDFVFLASLLLRHDVEELGSTLTSKDRKRISAAYEPLLSDRRHPVWSTTTEPESIDFGIEKLKQDKDFRKYQVKIQPILIVFCFLFWFKLYNEEFEPD